MAIVSRQDNLFAAEDWKVAYKAFSQVNFQAYDFDTMRAALVDYVKTNFPENFNDYTDASEMIAIIEMLAYLSQSLAFRMDLNSRENFLETAERRDSVFKLARMLGYNPKRNVPASGLMKVTAIRTTEPVTDSIGNELNNINVFWDDANNPDSYEQFITILNSAMSSTNRFSTPVKSGKVAGIATDIYEVNTQLNSPLVYNFQLNVSGVSMPFQAVNPDFEDGGVFSEQHPDPSNNYNLIYRNDGLGISSVNTGFFVMFKQGVLQTEDFNYTTPIESRVQDVTTADINETDVFLQEINKSGSVLNKWTKIPNTVGQTLNYNDIALDTRDLYSTENLNNDGVRIRFPDGNFGNIPVGLFRLHYRTSKGESFSIHPEDARNVTISIPYENAQGTSFTLTVTMSLQESVSNSLPPETLEAIKSRAPQVFYTQNRMVSGQDYNIFPLSQSTNITKLKAINRTHAGHSRFIDINDPTGTYQNVETFTEDGALYSEFLDGTDSVIVTENNTTSEIISGTLPVILKDQNLNNFVYDNFRKTWIENNNNKFDLSGLGTIWRTLPVVSGTSLTGYFDETISDPGNTSVLDNTYSGFEMFNENTFMKFVDPADQTQYKWARIVSVDNNGTLSSGLSTAVGPFLLSTDVQNGWQPYEYIATMRKTFTTSEEALIKAEMDNKRSFGLRYDTDADVWYVIANEDLDKTGDWSADNTGSTTALGEDASWLLKFIYTPIDTSSYKYLITMRGQYYVVQSRNDLKFYNIDNVKVADSENQASRDTVTFTTLNFKPGGEETFKWLDTDANDIGDMWESDETFEQYLSVDYDTGIPLRTRSTKWYDVEIDYVTSSGIFKNGDFAANVFVNQAALALNPYFADGTEGASGTSNITIANNSGKITQWAANIVVEFSNTTFGFNILDSANGNVVYRDYYPATGNTEIFQANAGGVTKSFGVNGASYNAASTGRLIFANANITAQTGNLVITNMDENNYSHVYDSASNLSQDKLVVKYKTNKTKLDQDVVWNAIQPVKYDDGYTDNRKMIVAAVDTDGDLVPDRPLQFSELISEADLVFFEFYTDFDGYTYNRPLAGGIVDYRNEDVLNINIGDEEVYPGSRVNSVTDLSAQRVIIVKNDTFIVGSGSQIGLNNTAGKLIGLVVYDFNTKIIYQMVSSSTNPLIVEATVTEDYFVRNGRSAGQNTALIENDEIIFKWSHVAPKDVRIDPSVSNVVEMLILSTGYYNEVQKYKNVPGTTWPLSPTSAELKNEFTALDEFKSASDTLVYRSADFKLLFGTDAASECQARFRIVKLQNTVLSDNEIKSRVITAFNEYFAITNWEFGETFYFTELSSYVHQQLGSNIGSIVIIPKNSQGSFGDLFQIKAEPNQLFLNTAKVSDIEIIDKISSQTLRADR